MTCIAETPVPTGRFAAIAGWTRTLFARLQQDRGRGIARLEPSNLSRHLLKDMGLTDRDVA
jgi:uncharacterized protein YjiS (DUF1127 family)